MYPLPATVAYKLTSKAAFTSAYFSLWNSWYAEAAGLISLIVLSPAWLCSEITRQPTVKIGWNRRIDIVIHLTVHVDVHELAVVAAKPPRRIYELQQPTNCQFCCLVGTQIVFKNKIVKYLKTFEGVSITTRSKKENGSAEVHCFFSTTPCGLMELVIFLNVIKVMIKQPAFSAVRRFEYWQGYVTLGQYRSEWLVKNRKGFNASLKSFDWENLAHHRGGNWDLWWQI